MSRISTEIEQRVQEYLDTQNWHYTHENGVRLQLVIGGQLEKCWVNIRVLVYGNEQYCVHVCATCPMLVPTHKKKAATEFITRANHLMYKCYFSYRATVDEADQGVIGCNSWLYCGDSVPSLGDVEIAVDLSYQVLYFFGDAFVNVLMHDADPASEFKRMEEKG